MRPWTPTSGSDFSDVSLAGATFHNVNLARASIDDANLSELEIRNANLKNASIVDSATDGMTIDGIAVSDLLSTYRASQLKSK